MAACQELRRNFSTGLFNRTRQHWFSECGLFQYGDVEREHRQLQRQRTWCLQPGPFEHGVPSTQATHNAGWFPATGSINTGAFNAGDMNNGDFSTGDANNLPLGQDGLQFAITS